MYICVFLCMPLYSHCIYPSVYTYKIKLSSKSENLFTKNVKVGKSFAPTGKNASFKVSSVMGKMTAAIIAMKPIVLVGCCSVFFAIGELGREGEMVFVYVPVCAWVCVYIPYIQIEGTGS